MTKQFCDKYAKDITGKQSAHVEVVDDADEQGNGDITVEVDLCSKCLIKLKGWLASRVPA